MSPPSYACFWQEVYRGRGRLSALCGRLKYARALHRYGPWLPVKRWECGTDYGTAVKWFRTTHRTVYRSGNNRLRRPYPETLDTPAKPGGGGVCFACGAVK
ncbi:hypothetical protein KCP69_07560 [Salmonella enterica subsp. enterica]|nr:hypothetical protein KCP69_07560 [Salmonella enterica subsp. enterica]